jgi:hypothetical protein
MIKKSMLLILIILICSTLSLAEQECTGDSCLNLLSVKGGILEDQNGKQINFWGVNYYPYASWHYEQLEEAGSLTLEQKKQAVYDDLDDLQFMDINYLRLQVFDSELTNSLGEIVDETNPHLKLMDYLIYECNRRNMKILLSINGWLWSPYQRDDAISRIKARESAMVVKDYWPEQENFIKELLNHVNSYTGNKLAEEPSIALLDLYGEPNYWKYDVINNPDDWLEPLNDDSPDSETNLQTGFYNKAIDERSLNAVIESFEEHDAYVRQNGFTGTREESYGVFFYFRVKDYIKRMKLAIRSTGAMQPVGYSLFLAGNNRNIASEASSLNRDSVKNAVADSDADFILFGAYPGGWDSDNTDNINSLSKTGQNVIDAGMLSLNELKNKFPNKGKVVYEWGTPGDVEKIYLMPAMAEKWRSLGVQVAGFFQYDSKTTAPLNGIDWGWGEKMYERDEWYNFFLNLHHTPSQAVSFMIARKYFYIYSLWTNFNIVGGDKLITPTTAVSYEKNAAYYVDDWTYMQAKESEWKPFNSFIPSQLKQITCVGNCKYWQYSGNGIVDYRKPPKSSYEQLTIFPNVERDYSRGLSGSDQRPVSNEDPLTSLDYTSNELIFNNPNMFKKGFIQKQEGNNWIKIGKVDEILSVIPGNYRFVEIVEKCNTPSDCYDLIITNKQEAISTWINNNIILDKAIEIIVD